MKYVVIVFLFMAFVLSGCVNPGNDSDFINMVKVNAGTFSMGDTRNQGCDDEKPAHWVTLTHDYYIGKYEVTNEEYCAFLNAAEVNANGSKDGKELIDINSFRCQIEHYGTAFFVENNMEKYPVGEVTWWGSIYYCNWLSDKEGVTESYNLSTGELLNYPDNKGYRLPTEAEWEYAARGATNTPDYLYSGSDNIYEVAWHSSNSGSHIHEVGTKNPNGVGTYDMSGNVWEWCNDWYGSDYYSLSPSQNPVGPLQGSRRIVRGGACNLYGACRVTVRARNAPSDDYGVLGFRICKTK